jgi:hypothetical protein
VLPDAGTPSPAPFGGPGGGSVLASPKRLCSSDPLEWPADFAIAIARSTDVRARFGANGSRATASSEALP